MRSSFLDYITVRGFKSIASLEKLPLKSINILIGANGSGKSNFIGVFSFLHAIREGHLQDYVVKAGGAEKILHFGSKITEQTKFRLSFEDKKNQYALSLGVTEDDTLHPHAESVFFWDKQYHPKPYEDTLSPRSRGREAGISDPDSQGIAGYVREH